MRVILGGVRQLLWNDDQRRLRAPLRLAAMAGAFLVVVLAIDAVSALLDSVGATPGEGVSVLSVMALYVVGVLTIGRSIDRRRLSDYGLGTDSRWQRDLLGGLAIGVGMVSLTVLVGLLVGGLSAGATLIEHETGLFPGLSPTTGTLAGMLFMVLFVLLYELLFRGFVLVNVAEGLVGATTERTAVLGGVLVSASLFAVVHAPLSAVAPVTLLTLFFFSLLVGCVVAVTGRLAGALGIHAGWAILAGPVFGTPFRSVEASSALLALEGDGSTALTGGSFGLDGGLLALCGLFAGALCLLGWVRYGSLALTVSSQVTTPDLLDRDQW